MTIDDAQKEINQIMEREADCQYCVAIYVDEFLRKHPEFDVIAHKTDHLDVFEYQVVLK